MWPDRRLLDRLHLDHPIVQAPMAGAMDWTLAAEVSAAGGLGSLPCAMLGPDQIHQEVARIRTRTDRPFNLNFFTHAQAPVDEARLQAWQGRLAPYYQELGVEPAGPAGPGRAPFDEALCEVVEALRPAVVSFHFGLPAPALLERVRATGCLVLASATTVAEATWLAARGVDAIVAQGVEAGGHRGMFLTEDTSTQPGTLALVPQVVDAVSVPVIAAGGIADARGIAAAMALGAAAVQIGTAYLRCPEARVSAVHRAALGTVTDEGTALTRVLTGRPARGIVTRAMRELAPHAADAPAFPYAALPMAPLRAAAEPQGSSDFSPLWCGQAAPLGRDAPAGELTRRLAAETLALLRRLGAAPAAT
jgi:nitronate monooxygenase